MTDSSIILDYNVCEAVTISKALDVSHLCKKTRGIVPILNPLKTSENMFSGGIKGEHGKAIKAAIKSILLLWVKCENGGNEQPSLSFIQGHPSPTLMLIYFGNISL